MVYFILHELKIYGPLSLEQVKCFYERGNHKRLYVVGAYKIILCFLVLSSIYGCLGRLKKTLDTNPKLV